MSDWSAYLDLINMSPFADAIKLNEPLSRYTVVRLGGPADMLIRADSAYALRYFAEECWRRNIPTRIIGGGANLLFSDDGYRGVIIVNNAKACKIEDDGVFAESGVSLTQLARETMAHGLTGFEWAISVPGTLGGAIVNNAGAHGSDMSTSHLSEVHILFDNGRFDDRQVDSWTTEQLVYGYRESALKHNARRYVLLSAQFYFPLEDAPVLRARANSYIAHRKHTQPPGASLGSMFKNPPGDYAGRLIEAAELKGARAGGVVISPIHANFFVNTGGGTARDYVTLIRLAQQTVHDKFGVELELEIELIGE